MFANKLERNTPQSQLAVSRLQQLQTESTLSFRASQANNYSFDAARAKLLAMRRVESKKPQGAWVPTWVRARSK